MIFFKLFEKVEKKEYPHFSWIAVWFEFYRLNVKFNINSFFNAAAENKNSVQQKKRKYKIITACRQRPNIGDRNLEFWNVFTVLLLWIKSNCIYLQVRGVLSKAGDFYSRIFILWFWLEHFKAKKTIIGYKTI